MEAGHTDAEGKGGRGDFEPGGEDPGRAEPELLEWWLVPLILCGVAALQMVLAHTVGLSPWKGGGFGMFASVDSPSMRTVTVEGLDAEGNRVRIDAFDIMSRVDRLKWRSWPENALLEKLADRIGALDYLPSGSQRDLALEKLRGENPDLELPEEDGSGEWVRPWRAGDPEGVAKPLRAVRVEGWRLRYVPGENRVEMEALGEAVLRGDWP